ncbi:hypothetical protein T484DRAFT_1625092, partial [Baffinella frigidus]
QGPGFRAQSPGFRVQGPGSRVQGPGSSPGFRVQGPGSRVQSRVQGSGSRVAALSALDPGVAAHTTMSPPHPSSPQLLVSWRPIDAPSKRRCRHFFTHETPVLSGHYEEPHRCNVTNN